MTDGASTPFIYSPRRRVKIDLVVSYKKPYTEYRNTSKKAIISQTPSFGKKLTNTSQKDESLLRAAALDQNSEAVEKLLCTDGGGCVKRVSAGVSLLYQAWRLLGLQRRADMMKTSVFIKPLQFAAMRGNSDVALLLVVAGADVDDVVNGHPGFDLMF